MSQAFNEEGFERLVERFMLFYDELCKPNNTPSLRAAIRLARYRLSWLVVPWTFVDTLWSVFHAMRDMAAHEAKLTAAGKSYQALSGKNRPAGEDELLEVADQLSEIDGRFIPDWGLEDPPFADEEQLRIAAGALLAFFAADKKTDDEALSVVQAAYDRLDSIGEASDAADRPTSRRLRREQRQQLRDQEEDARVEYIRAWVAWFQAHTATR